MKICNKRNEESKRKVVDKRISRSITIKEKKLTK
jgi:hypothetical protein